MHLSDAGPGAFDLPDTYRCIDCEALLQDISKSVCSECEAFSHEWERKTIQEWRETQ